MSSKIIFRFFLKRKAIILFISIAFFCGFASAQDSAALPGKKASSLQLTFYNKAADGKTLMAAVKAKANNGKFFPAKNVKVNFYVQNNKEQILLTSASSDNAGKIFINLPDNLPLDTGRCIVVIAKVENDSVCDDASEQVRFKLANLSISINPKDTVKLVTATVTEIGKDGKPVPVKGVEVKFFVQRLFGAMPGTEDNSVTTDENGVASFTFPNDIKGDTAKNINLLARIDNNEQFGNIESKKIIAPWGIALVKEKNPFPRALWEPTAPFPLIITIAVLFGGVWSVYFFILFQLRQVKKETALTDKTVKIKT